MTAVPGVMAAMGTAPMNVSGASRSYARTSSSGKAARSAGRMSAEPTRWSSWQGSVRSARVQAEPRSRSASQWTSSMTTTSRGTSSSVVQATNGRLGVDALLARAQAGDVLAEPVAQPFVDLLGHQPQRAAVRAGPGTGQDLERGVRLAGVGGSQVGHDALRCGPRREHRAQRRGHGFAI